MIGSITDISNADKTTLDGNLLYIAQGNDKYIIVDIFDPANPIYYPTQINYNTNKISVVSGFAHEIQIHGDMLFLADGSGGFLTIYNANPFNPIANQWVQSSYIGTGASTRRFIVKDGLTYTAVHEGGFRIYNFNDIGFCPVDYDQDGQLTADDANEFYWGIKHQLPRSDLNGDLNHDFYDVSIFFNFFTQGCP